MAFLKDEDLRGFSTRGRKVLVRQGRAVIPHRVKPTGETVTKENFDARVDISDLNQNELRFLEIFRESGWDFEKACEKANVEVVAARMTYKKCLWFPQEDAYVKAKAKVPTPEYILAKDLDNVEKAVPLDDSQHKSLDRLAKITGAFKATEVNVQQNVFNLNLTPEQQKRYEVLASEVLEAGNA